MSVTERHGGLEPAGLFDLVKTGLAVVGIDDGRVRRANDAACDLAGRIRADYVGRHWRELVDPAEIDDLADDLGQLADGAGSSRRVVRLARPDGVDVRVLVSTSRVSVDGESCALAQFEDVTEFVSTEMQLRLLLDHTPVSIFLIDHEGRVLLAGGSETQPPAVAMRRAVQSNYFTVFRHEAAFLAMMRRSLRGEHVHEVVCRNGRWYDVQLVPVPGAAGQPPSVAGVVSNVTEREHATAELLVRTAHQTALADLAQRALEIADERTLWDAGTRTLRSQLGADLVTIRPATDAATPDTRKEATPTVTCVPIGHTGRPIGTVTVRRPARPLTADDHAFIRSVAAVLGAASLRIRMEEASRQRPLQDPLTGLPNRNALLDRLRRRLHRGGCGERRSGVLFIDLDGFKAVNDTLGHQAGDELLRVVASRLREAVRPGDIVGRLAGDEFAVLCDDIGDLDQLRGIGERLIATALAPPIELRRPVSVSGSVGLALSAPDLTDAEKLLNAADMAMYDAKRGGPGRLVAYDDRIREALDLRLHDITDLRRAVGAGELMLRFEPVASRAGVVVAAEAVPYWTHPTRGVLNPDDLSPIAFDAGLTIDIDRWLVDNVAGMLTPQAADALAGALPGERSDSHEQAPRPQLWLRISERGLKDAALRRTITSRPWGPPQASGGRSPALCVLVPQRFTNRDPHTLDTITSELSGAGVAVRLDLAEIGGFRSASRDTIPPGLDGVRLGRQNVHGVEHGGMAVAIFAGLVHFAHMVHLDVAARGVDTPGQLSAIRGLGCDLVQGAAVGPPLPAPPW